ncbi:lipopolysaccharide biosynthesis protein [Flavisolibacter nicotianae]|uniref:lipopolysaccharide biosynthesis protein n=1 Tax=Flavisolibacter nicotianae TaxID=2364882 RepID=UPI000EACECD8|nr:MATE family efflux transporter [Flavisolibacter nicotianae]
MSAHHFSFVRSLKKTKAFVDFNALKPVFYRVVRLGVMNVAGVALVFLTNYLLIRVAGETAYGNYSIITVWVNLFLVLVVFGYDDYFIAKVPQLQSRNQSLRPLLQQALKLTSFVFVVVVAVVILLFLANLLPPVIAGYKVLFFAVLALTTLFTLLQAFFRSVNLIGLGQVFEKIVRPGLVLAGIFAFYLLQRHVVFESILLVHLLSLLAVCLLLIRRLRKITSMEAITGEFLKPEVKSNLSFLGISLLYLLSTRLDLIFLSQQVVPQEVGYYNLAARIGDLVGYPLTAINLVIHTMLSQQYAGNNKDRIFQTTARITVFSFGMTAFVFLVILLFGESILGIFGESYRKSFPALRILSCSHLVYSLSLPFNAYFMVSQNERLSLASLAANVIATFLLAFFWVPDMGSRGAALAVLGGSIVYFLATGLFAFRQYQLGKEQRAITSK